MAAAFCSADVGGDCSGRDKICPTVSLDGENVDEVLLQPDSTCCLRWSRVTTIEHGLLSHSMSSAEITLSTTSDAGVNDVDVIE